jgi:hypothetical protein
MSPGVGENIGTQPYYPEDDIMSGEIEDFSSPMMQKQSTFSMGSPLQRNAHL